jgi:Zn finger protein HypA/HybF involved in hydrogenase expression
MTQQKANGMKKQNLPEMTNSHPNGEHEKQCPNCNRVFKTDDSRVIYCSPQCKQRMAAKIRYQRGLVARKSEHHVEDGKYVRTCRNCGSLFRTNSKQAKYHSEACRQAAYNKRYYKRNKKKIVARVTETRRAKRQQQN